MSKSRSGAPRRVAAGLLAGALAIFGLALAPAPAGAAADVSTDRYAGVNRYATAGAVAGQDDFAGATTAILATGQTFPDALAASGLAGVDAPAPIILTESDNYTTEAQDALAALGSLTTVIVVGGTAAVSDDVVDAVTADGYDVTRVAGNDRYETAAAIANEIGAGSVGSIGGLVTALIATGTGFADALAGGPVAYANGMPILLVQPNAVPAATEAALGDLGIEQVVILGGTAAVSDEVQASLEDITGAPAIRVAGDNRFGTAAAVGEFGVDELGWAPNEVLLANGLNFPDALSGGPLAGGRAAPILLLASVPDETAQYLDDHSDTITDVECLGGTAACSEDDLAGAESSAETVDNDSDVPTNTTATSRPELVSASLVETRIQAAATATRPAGTYILYCFDEAVTGAGLSGPDFHLYNGDGTRFSSVSGAQTPSAGQTFTNQVSPTDNKCAEVLFTGLNTVALASNLTLATVDNGAATGSAGAATDTNIEGDAPLTPSSSTTAAAGTTAAPDLLSVGNFRDGSTIDVTAVDFTFDSAAFVRPAADFRLVNINGTGANCSGPAAGSTTASGLATPGGEGTTVITVNCVDPVAGVAGGFFTATNTARGTVGAGSVATTTGGVSPNPLEAADVVGASDGPDLSLVLFSPDAVVSSDVVSYLFDEDVQAGTGTSATYTTTSSFGIYNTAGTERLNTYVFVGGTDYCARSSEGNTVVSCVLPDGVLSAATYVGGNVRAGAVTEVNGGATIVNREDEEGASPSAGPASGSSGTTDGPDLRTVAIAPVVSPFGNTTYSVTYTFDEDTSDTGDAASTAVTATDDVILQLLHLYLADGIRLDCNSIGLPSASAVLANRSEDVDNTVVCTGYIVGGTATAATQAQIHAAVVGTVDFGAVDDETVGASGDVSPEGAALASGSNGTPV